MFLGLLSLAFPVLHGSPCTFSTSLTHSHGLVELLAVNSLTLYPLSLPVLCQCCLLDSRTWVPGPVPPFGQPGKLTHPLPLTCRSPESILRASWAPLVDSSAMTYPLCLIVQALSPPAIAEVSSPRAELCLPQKPKKQRRGRGWQFLS